MRLLRDAEPWSKTKRTWLSAACRIGELLGHHYIFIPELDAQCERVIAVRVKIVHQKTQWSQGRLFSRRATEPVSIVANGKSRTLTRHDLTHRSSWNSVTGTVPNTGQSAKT